MANRLKIKEIREIKNLTQDDVVRLSGVPKRSYNDYESGKTDIPASRLQDIAKALDVTVGVIFGYSDPETSESYEDRVREDEEFYTERTSSKFEKTNFKFKEDGVPYYDIDFTASFLEIENNQQSKPDQYVTHPFFVGCDFIVRASGQSMAKVIKHGDAIGLIEIKEWQAFIPLGEIYAIVTRNGFRMIKVVTKGENVDSYTLISKPSDGKANEFPPQQIEKKQILSIFRVQASSHLF